MNKRRFGIAMKLGSDPCKDPAGYAQALADEGHYPAGMADCDAVGLGGGCGDKCPVYLAGKCPVDAQREGGR